MIQFATRIAPGAHANLRMSDRLRALHGVFFASDADTSGKLALDEFVRGVVPLVGPLDGAEAQFLFDAFDVTRDRKIDLAEFDFAIFRDLQTSGDLVDVRAALAALLLRKLAAYRALAPGERGNIGSKVDDNMVDLHQKRVIAAQKRGRGLCAAVAQVLSSTTGVVSLLGLAALAAGIPLGLIMNEKMYFALAGVGYAVYFFASFMGHDFSLLSNPVAGADGLAAQFDRVYRANAAFRWHIECYHYEERSHTDSKGHRHTRRVRVTTYTATREGRLRSFEASPPFVPNADSHALMQVIARVRVQVRFVEYFQARDLWRAANTRDTHQDFSASELVPELMAETLVEYVAGLRPAWMTRGAFALATLLLSSMCFKVAFNSRCGRQEYEFVKDVVAFSEDALSEEAHAYDQERAGSASVVYALSPAQPQFVVIPATAVAIVPPR